MHSFTDAKRRTWPLTITVRTIKRVREMASVDLMGIAGGDLLTRLGSDVVLLVDVLWAVIQPKAEAEQITADDFAEGMLGDALEAATDALLRELAEFFPTQTRTLLLRVLDAAKVQQDKLISLALARSDQLLQAPATSGDSSSSAPASPDSTPPT